MIRAVVFDWADTVMRDFGLKGCMADWPQVEAMPGIEAALAALSSRYRLALATNAADSGEVRVREALARVGLERFFEKVLTARELGVSKPSREFFQAVLARRGCAPGEAVMVGDSFTADVEGAKAVGMRAVWLSWRGAPPPRPSADLVLGSLEGLCAGVDRLAEPSAAS